MKIVTDYPPNVDEIRLVFPISDSVIFAWGDTIFNPGGGEIPPELIEHEEVHGTRQGNDPKGWWDRYLIDPAFRLAEEVPAHKEEFRWIVQNANRAERRRALLLISERLASPLYGKMIRPQEAKKIIKGVLNEC